MTLKLISRRMILLATIAVVTQNITHAQVDTTKATGLDSLDAGRGSRSADTTSKQKHWYDTLTVTKPRYAQRTNLERLQLSAFIALAIPVGMIVGVTTIMPPGFTALYEDDKLRGGVSLHTGIGFGRQGDTSAFYFFPALRLQLEGAYFFNREERYLLRSSLLVDHRFGSIHERDFYWLGVAGGGGISTDFKTVSPFVEGWVGVLNPAGIRFITLFPMHHYGLRARAGYSFQTNRPWYELSLAATATFWL